MSDPGRRTRYGDKYQEHLLEQYKLFVEMADRVSARRLATNQYFLAINTGLITLLGAASALGFDTLKVGWGFFVSAAGMVLCYAWYRLVRSYNGLNTGKFAVIHELERELPFELFKVEWAKLGEGKDKKKYLPFSSVEGIVPWVFIGLYLVILVWTVLAAVSG